MELPLPLFLDTFRAWAYERMDKKARDDFDYQLNKVPAGLEDDVIRTMAGFSEEEQAASFLSMFAKRGGVGLPSSVVVADPSAGVV